MSTLPNDRRYTKDHEWALLEGNTVTVGVTAFAVQQLGDITMVSVDASTGDHLESGTSFGAIESVKSSSDMFAPVSGQLNEINSSLDDTPELINEDCYGKGWIIKIACSDIGGFSELMDVEAYAQHIKQADQH